MENNHENTNPTLSTPNPGSNGPPKGPPRLVNARDERTRNTQKLLRRWVGRSLSMLMRHLGIDPVHDAFEQILAQRGAAFAKAYDAVVAEGKAGSDVRGRLAPAISRLKAVIRKWRPLLSIHQVPDLPEPTSGLAHDEDVISWATQVREFLTEERIAGSTLTPQLVELFNQEIGDATQAAEALVAESQRLNATRQQELAEARRTARAYEDVLVAYRQTLRVLLGRGHTDVRAITKMARSVQVADEAGSAGESPPAVGIVDEDVSDTEDDANAEVAA